MILVDTSVLVDWLRAPSLRVRGLIVERETAVWGVTVAELLTGVRNPDDRRRVETVLTLFGRLPIEEPVWEAAGALMGVLSQRGTRIPFPDALIAATAIHHSVPLWTRDRHFAAARLAAPDLILFDEEHA